MRFGCKVRRRTGLDTQFPSQGYGVKGRVVNALAALGFIFGLVSGAEAQDGAKTVLALGDSLTAGYGLDHQDGFVPQLEAALRAKGVNVKIVNAGVSGDTSAGGRARLDWLLTPDIDAVIVELGANDGLRGLDPAQTRANIAWILTRLQEKAVPALLTGMMAPPNLGKDYGREFNTLYPDLAKAFDVVFDPFFLAGVAADPSLNQQDGIHPNKDGVAKIVERLMPKVDELLTRVP